MYHKKKIALFISHIYGVYQHSLCQGVISQAASYGYKTEIYTTSDGEDLGDYSLGEASILKIPNWQDIDGVIFASGTYTDEALRDRICDTLKSLNISCVEITETTPSFPRISLENNLTTGTLTAHLIDVHSAKTICYLGCQKEDFCSERRKKAFLSVMHQRALPISELNTYSCTETPEDYRAALAQFCSITGNPPDAIICYNDRIALGLFQEATLAGYRIPEDFGIVGCDNSPEGQNIIPPLTTVTFPTHELGVTSVDALFAILQGKTDYTTTVFAQPVFGGSCGCNYRPSNKNTAYVCKLADKISGMEHSTFRSMHMSTAFSHCKDIDAGMAALEKYIGDIEHCSEFYLCLYSDWDKLSDPILEYTKEEDTPTMKDTLLLKLGIKNGHRLPECCFEKNTLLPAFLNDSSDAAYIVCPLFFEKQVFGYVALAFENNRLNYPFRLVPFILNITQLLSNICDSKRTHILTKHLEDIYLRDSLTGLYNRHGFEQRVEDLFARNKPGGYLHAIVFDLDELKTINDHFGHEAGDLALKTIGQALLNLSEEAVCSRFGGDEFYCLIPDHSEVLSGEYTHRVTQYLEHFNKLSDKPYLISVSYGASCAPFADCRNMQDLEKLFALADEKMYLSKNAKIKKVLRS